MKKLLYLVIAISMVSCANETANNSASDSSVEGESTEQEVKNFGEIIEADGAIGFEELMSQLEQADTAEVKLQARVSDVCQKKGCWMNLVDANNTQAEPIFVKFKDYGFFMPLDLAGSDVVVRGKVYKSITPVEELRHYAEDAGKSEEEIAAITEPEEELNLMADGVVVTQRAKH